ncbi:glycosyltransferase family 39 protein [Runella slithyformis]|uniref:Glycosyl transferase family 39 n=1 Tax=Runella slithyformis (strain ATCC 29530 / DSM 19594 / LMG 11500 / NCIMB 11436 / LSU 4) TaxID=761193 RepID=A0A7U4E6Y2_RUNSL|nr:glycosyltransferase family 39 protein [Runella slithyformis]AEI49619.1 glycosyl transferase family 39 [Runella slithyformis DSM 19594]
MKTKSSFSIEKPWVVALLALVFFVPYLGNVHLFDWDEINFAESAREMLATGNYLRVQIDYQPFWEKPPLFIWIQALSMKVFGVNEFAARFPNAVVGIMTLLTFFFVGKRLIDVRFGFLWALAYLGSVTPHLYFKSGIIDPLFNYFMFLSVLFLLPALKKESPPRAMRFFWAGIFAGLAVWTKGPVGVGVPTLTLAAFWLLHYVQNRSSDASKPSDGYVGHLPFDGLLGFSLKNILIYGLTAGVLTAGWMLAIIWESGWATFIAFLEYLYRLGATSEADHGQPFYYHFVVVLVGCFPISVLGLPYVSRIFQPLLRKFVKRAHGITTPEQFRRGITNPAQLPEISNSASLPASDRSPLLTPHFFNAMLCLFWVVMIVFSIVKTKIVHYSSMTYFPLSFLAALWVYRWLKGEILWPRWMSVLLLIIGGILSLVLTAVPLIGMYSAAVTPYIDDAFVVANLQAPVEWAGYEWLFGVIYFAVIVLATILWKKQKVLTIRALLFATAILMFVYGAVVVPKIEGYTQRTVIDFYASKRGQNVYVWPIGFKSYAQFFYFKKPNGVRPEASHEDWLLNGPVDKPTFLISRIDRAEQFRNHPNLELIKEENGFVFFRRKPDYEKISESLTK